MRIKHLFWVLVLALLSFIFLCKAPQARSVQAVPEEEVLAAYTLLSEALSNSEMTYLDYLSFTKEEPGRDIAEAWPEEGQAEPGYEGSCRVLDYRQSAVYRLSITQAGWYWLKADYRPVGGTMSDFIVSMSVNGRQDYVEMANIALPLYWRSAEDVFPRDSYGDESAPGQQRIDSWRSLFFNSKLHTTAEPMLVKLNEGINEITLTNASGDGLMLGRLQALPPVWDIPDYEEYQDQ